MDNDEKRKEPFTLYEQKPNISDLIRTVNILSERLEYACNIEGKTFLVKCIPPKDAEMNELHHPLMLWTSYQLEDPPIYHVSKYEGFPNSYLYKERKVGGMQIVKREIESGLYGAKEWIVWINEINPKPEWASDCGGLPSDTWLLICSYLPLDKIFALSGMNKRLRGIIHGHKVRVQQDDGTVGFGWRGGINWRFYLSNLGSRPVPPTYPASLDPKNGAAYLNPSTLVKWGHRNENTMRKNGEPPAVSDERENNLGDLINEPEREYLIFVHVGDEGFVLPICVSSQTTPELLGSELRTHARFKKVSKSAIFEFKIKCPPKEEMMEMSDSQFELMGLDKPARQPDGTIKGIMYLPLTEDMIDWNPKTTIVHYNARENTRVDVKVFVRRYFKSDDNEKHKETIIDRFKSGKYCKHCYRPTVTTSGFGLKVPDAWIEMHKELAPICVHCFTHLHRDQIIHRKKSLPDKCPKCDGHTLRFQRNFRAPGQKFKEGELDYYQCTSCEDAPKLWCAFVRKIIIYKPVMDAWRAECSGKDDSIPDVIKRAREREKQKKIKKLEARIKKRKLEIEKDEAEMRELIGPERDADDPLEEEESSSEDLFKKPMPRKRPATLRPPGKKPVMSGKKPRMSPILTRVVNLEEEEEEDADYEDLDADEDEDEEEEEEEEEEDSFGVPLLDPLGLQGMSLFYN